VHADIEFFFNLVLDCGRFAKRHREDDVKKFGFLLATIAIAGFAATVGYNALAAGNSKQEITDLEHKCINATSTDQAASLGCFDEADIVLYDFIPPLEYSGDKAVRGDLDNFFNNAKNVKGNFVELVVVSDGKLGIAHSIQHFTWTTKDGKPMEATLRVTDALHKVGGRWKIFHTHVSVPVDPNTGKAQMNLSS
jgi:ketosteroid isomerase-like protein